MKVADILKTKGPAVKMVRPDETAKAFAAHLKDERIGAMIVSHDGSALDGIISERDLAYGLATYGDELLSMSVSELMTKAVIICTPEDSIAEVMNVMTSSASAICRSRMASSSSASSALAMSSKIVLARCN